MYTLIKNANKSLNYKNIYLFNRYFFAAKFRGITTVSGGKEETKTTSVPHLEIKQPLDLLLGALSACEVHSILYNTKSAGIPLEKIEVEVKGEYDLDIYLGKKQGRNTYTSIEVEARIQSNYEDKKKLEESVKKGEEQCPILSTLRLANIPIKSTIKYLS